MSEPRHVYFVQYHEGGPVKIGSARDVAQRVRDLQVGCPYELQLVGMVQDGGHELEKKIHKEFKSVRLRGEWFLPTAELMTFIETNSDTSNELVQRTLEVKQERAKRTRRRTLSTVIRSPTCKICKSEHVDVVDAYLIDGKHIQAEIRRRVESMYGLRLTAQNISVHARKHVAYPEVALS